MNIKTMLKDVERIFEAAQTELESKQVGERMQLKDLATAVGTAVSMDPKQVVGFVNHFAHNTDTAYVTRGKNGGIVRGTKPVKVVKVSKKAKKTDSVVADTASDVSTDTASV